MPRCALPLSCFIPVLIAYTWFRDPIFSEIFVLDYVSELKLITYLPISWTVRVGLCLSSHPFPSLPSRKYLSDLTEDVRIQVVEFLREIHEITVVRGTTRRRGL